MKGSSIFPYIYSLRVFLTGTSDPEVPRWSPSLGPNHPGVRFFHPFRFQGGEILFGKDPKLGRISWEFLLFCWRFVFERRPPIFFPANVSLEMLFFFGVWEVVFWRSWEVISLVRLASWKMTETLLILWKPWRTTKIFVLKTCDLKKSRITGDTSCWKSNQKRFEIYTPSNKNSFENLPGWQIPIGSSSSNHPIFRCVRAVSFREITRLVTLLSDFWDLKVNWLTFQHLQMQRSQRW